VSAVSRQQNEGHKHTLLWEDLGEKTISRLPNKTTFVHAVKGLPVSTLEPLEIPVPVLFSSPTQATAVYRAFVH
jgi:hypothetical protein